MAEFDLSQLGKNKTPNNETIDTTAGAVKRNRSDYITPEQARRINQNNPSRYNQSSNEPDPIFDTPPTFKLSKSDNNIQNLGEEPYKRTPVNAGSPKQATPKVHSKKDKEDVPDPTPLKVVDNYTGKFNPDDLQPFNVNSLPKKKQEMGKAESEDMLNLSKAVDREIESITERVQALTDKQYEEYLEARAEGKHIDRPLTDEEVEEQERARLEKESSDEEEEEIHMEKEIIIGDEDNHEEISVDNSTEIDNLTKVCMNAINHVDNHSISKDYFSRVLMARSYLSQHKIYGEIWAIVMYNHENEAVVHPFLIVRKNGITAAVECNLDNIKGIHILDPNDTIESLYTSFQHKGYLYEYIDYLAKTVTVKLPADMPTLENALKIANEKLGVNTMEENKAIPDIEDIIPSEEKQSEKIDDLDDALNQDEAESFYQMIKGTDEENNSNTEENTSDDIVEKSYDFVNNASDEVMEEVVSDDTSINEEVHTDDNSITISKDYEGDEAYQLASSDDLAKDLEDELSVDVDENSPSEEDMLNELKAAVKKNIPSVKNRINLREFKISDSPISASKVAGFSIKDLNQADWVLPNAQKVITVRGLSGPELFAMNPQNSNKNRINTFRQIYGIIYKHVVSKKPRTFDEWLKVTRFSDVDHLYAALHRATFAGSNFVHYECPECKHVFIKDYAFEDMVKYRDDEAKAKITRILNSGDSSIPKYTVKMSQISDNYVVGLKDPSIWNMVMETAALSDSFLTKYEDLLDTMSFIDSIYVIDRDHNRLTPIDFDYDKDDPAKSTARKIMILSDIIRTLSSDSYFDLRNQIAQLFGSSNDMTYKIPEAVCPKCKHKFEETPTDGNSLLFTRHQLGALGVI